MTMNLLEKIAAEATQLSADEQLLLAQRLIERVRLGTSKVAQEQLEKTLTWSDIRGMAAPSLFGEDAQAWVTRTRREGDQHREQNLKRNL
ncbi:MAG: hypothetical protein KF893_11230 [Caldilineaceae bacterium]|nr:hypothetical protein [Caldilineaceae bacterium]